MRNNLNNPVPLRAAKFCRAPEFHRKYSCQTGLGRKDNGKVNNLQFTLRKRHPLANLTQGAPAITTWMEISAGSKLVSAAV